MKGGLSATLMLNNKGPLPLEVQPTLFSLAGQRLDIAPVTVEGNSFRMIDLSEWAALGGDAFQEGSVQLFHHGRDLVLGAQIYLVDAEHSLSFDEKLVQIGVFGSTRLEGIWWMPSRESEVTLVLSNTSDDPLSVTARLAGSQHQSEGPQIFNLSPHETRVLDVRRDFSAGEDCAKSEVEAISLEHAGAKSALIARAMVQDTRKGYSFPVQFSNPQGGKSQQYHGAGLRLGKIAGEPLTPVVVARNVGDTTTVLSGRVPYTTASGTFGVVSLPSTKLRPGDMKLIDLQRVIEKSEVERNIAAAGLEFEYTTAPGSVMISAESVTSSGNQVFRVPMWDPLAQRSPTGGYPWYIEGDSSTTVYIKNITDHPQQYVAHILFAGGVYTAGVQTVEGRQTIAFNLCELRDDQVPDEEGRTIPLDVSRGQILWSLEQNAPSDAPSEFEGLALIGRSEQVDISEGISSNYACQNCCINDFAGGEIEPPAPPDGDVGSAVQFKAYQYKDTCYDVLLRSQASNVTWSSTNTSAVIIDSSGLAVAIGGGSTTIKAQWQVRTSYSEPCDPSPGLSAPSPDVTIASGDAPEPDFAACGSCLPLYTNYIKSADWTVKPKVTISASQTIMDGETAQFTVTVEGATPTGYQWSFTAPSDAGNNPNVTFTPGNQAQTTTNGHWFARPNAECDQNGNNASNPISTYTVKCTVTFSDNISSKTVQTTLRVNGLWDPAGQTDPNTATITGGPLIGTNANGVWVVKGQGSMKRVIPTKVVLIPNTSQFFTKADAHEQNHVDQWATGQLFGNTFIVADQYALIRNLTGTSQADLQNKIAAQFQLYASQQEQFITTNHNLGERLAYQVSDPIAPRYLYQRCGKYSQ
jgi:hypothetical protein